MDQTEKEKKKPRELLEELLSYAQDLDQSLDDHLGSIIGERGLEPKNPSDNQE